MQLLIRLIQALRQTRGAQLGVQHRSEQRKAENRERAERDPHRQSLAAYALRQRHAVTAELRRRHAGIVHAGNGDAHHQRAERAHGQQIFFALAQIERQPERGGGGEVGDGDRERHQRKAPVRRGRDQQRKHAGIVHRHDAAAEHGAARQPASAAKTPVLGLRERQHTGGAGRQQRQQRQAHVVAHRHHHRQHADKVHRPDADAHRHAAGHQPYPRHPAVRHCDAPRRVQRGEGGNKSDDQRNADQSAIPGDQQHLQLPTARLWAGAVL